VESISFDKFPFHSWPISFLFYAFNFVVNLFNKERYFHILSVVLMSFIFILQSFFNVRFAYIALMSFLSCVAGARIFYLIKNQRYLPGGLTCKLMASNRTIALLLLTIMPFVVQIYSNFLSVISWMGAGDATNWMVIYRENRVITPGHIFSTLSTTPGVTILGNVISPLHSVEIDTQFIRDVHGLFATQMIFYWLISTLIFSRLAASLGRQWLAWVATITISWGSLLLGPAHKNGYLSYIASVYGVLIFFEFANRGLLSIKNFRLTISAVVVLSVYFLFVWPLLSPVLLLTTLLILILDMSRLRRIMLVFIPIAIPVYIIVLRRCIHWIDVGGTFSSPRGPMFTQFHLYGLLIAFAFLSFVYLRSNLQTAHFFVYVISVFSTCSVLFSLYPSGSFWNRFNTYYPQKLFFISVIGGIFGCVSRICIVSKQKNNSFRAGSSFLSFSLILGMIFYAQAQVDMRAYPFDVIFKDFGAAYHNGVEDMDPNMFIDLLQKSKLNKPFGFWHYYPWPAESGALSWAGVIWENYPGNLSRQHPISSSLSIVSGPFGNRDWHNGDPSDSSNLCRMAELLGPNGVIFTRDKIKTDLEISSCPNQIRPKILTS
jgi:hypothetical protein